ncbi:hypothetical protein Pmani_007808 [Petrolisthes manimaculis]|uniref:Uncharacterized protein n=1 Tax=Petrolisthes manimaculis TaxID=1843537 RepID=A0AAE1Q6Q1_9EUCA|nr:hypothetical protein Pmani_007808 [Petrolisthes manimaculis]
MKEERGARQKTKAGRAKMKDQTTSVCESECRGCIGILAGNWNDGGPVMMEWNCEPGMTKSSWNGGKMWNGGEGMARWKRDCEVPEKRWNGSKHLEL